MEATEAGETSWWEPVTNSLSLQEVAWEGKSQSSLGSDTMAHLLCGDPGRDPPVILLSLIHSFIGFTR